MVQNPSTSFDSTPSLPNETGSQATGKPGGFARLGAKIRRRTTDLLAIAIMAIGGLSIGGRVSQWWSTDANEVISPMRLAESTSGWGAEGAPVSVAFGDQSYSLGKQMVAGNRQRASAVLLQCCRRVVESAGYPHRKPDPAERKLIAQTEQLDPVAEDPDVWKLFQLDASLPLVVGTRRFSAAPVADDAPTGPEFGWRVVCWGMAFPSEGQRWALFTLRAPQPALESILPQLQLPTSCKQTLSLRSDTGETLIAFEGDGPAEVWVRFFDGWFAKHGWQPAGGWQSSPASWSKRYRTTGDRGLGRIDVQLVRTGRSRWAGLLSITPWPNSERRGRP